MKVRWFAAALFASGAAFGQQATPTAKAESARTQRLTEQRRALEAELAAIEKFGHLDEFLAAVKKNVAPRPEVPRFSPGLPVADGSIDYLAIAHYAAWNTPAAGRTKPVAIDAEVPNHPFAAIVDLDHQLRAHRIDLLLVVVPTRLELYPELMIPLPSLEGFAGMAANDVRFLLELNRAGVETLSLGPPLVAARYGADPSIKGEQLFLRHDPHWAPRGAETAAKAVASTLAGFPWFVRGPLQERRSFDLASVTFTYNSYSELAAAGAEPELMSATAVTFRRQLTATAKCGRILVMGDSFLVLHRDHQADFISQLARFTGQPVDLDFTPGVASMEACRKKLAALTAAEWNEKRIVVWLVPSRELLVSERWAPIEVFHE